MKTIYKAEIKVLRLGDEAPQVFTFPIKAERDQFLKTLVIIEPEIEFVLSEEEAA